MEGNGLLKPFSGQNTEREDPKDVGKVFSHVGWSLGIHKSYGAPDRLEGRCYPVVLDSLWPRYGDEREDNTQYEREF